MTVTIPRLRLGPSSTQVVPNPRFEGTNKLRLLVPSALRARAAPQAKRSASQYTRTRAFRALAKKYPYGYTESHEHHSPLGRI